MLSLTTQLGCIDRSWQWPGVARRLWPLAPTLAPRPAWCFLCSSELNQCRSAIAEAGLGRDCSRIALTCGDRTPLHPRQTKPLGAFVDSPVWWLFQSPT
jgi:hypothetical protein